MSLGKVTIDEFLKFIKEQYEMGIYKPIVGFGKSGIGKTESIVGLCKEMGIGCMSLRLVDVLETDLVGMPFIEEIKDAKGNIDKRTAYAANTLLPSAERDGEKGILILDEITSCSKTARTAVFQLLEKRRQLGNYKLPDEWMVVALGNGIEDGGTCDGAELAFNNRGSAFEIIASPEKWIAWARNNNINSTIIAFINQNPNLLHTFDYNTSYGEITQEATPRSWENLSDILNKREEVLGKTLDSESVRIYALGFIGEETAVKFTVYYEANDQLIPIKDIAEGKHNGDVSNLKNEARYIVLENLLQYSKVLLKEHVKSKDQLDNEGQKQLVNIFKWIITVSKQHKDLVMGVLGELLKAHEAVVPIIIKPEFTTQCPELAKFLDENFKILS